ncbi:MAG: PAS domain S-box protein [Myxococcota bacterium]
MQGGKEEDPDPAAPPDFRRLFERCAGRYLVLSPENRIVGVSDAYCLATAMRREDILGRALFEVLPDDVANPNATWVRDLRASLERVRRERVPDQMPVQKCDVRWPAVEGGDFGERWWSPWNAPVLDDEGRLLYLIHRLEDVTDLVRLEERWARAEAEARRLAGTRERVAVDAAGMGVWDLDLRTGALTWSDTAFRMLGYEPTPNRRANSGMWLERVDPDDVPGVVEAIERARRERSLFTATHRVAVGGRTRWARSFGRFLYDDASGEPVRFVGVAFEDTERHEAEAARRQAEERLGLLVQSVREYALIAFDPDDRVVTWNEGGERIFGYTPVEALGMPRSAFYPPEQADQAARDAEAAVEEGSVAIEGWRVRKDGSRFWGDVVLTARRGEHGGIAGFLSVTRDLTQRRAAEERFRLALEAAPSGMVMVDSAGRIVLVNREAERLFGYPRADLIGRPVEVLVPPHLRAAHVAHREGYQRAPSARAMGGSRDLWGVRRDGTAFPVEVGLTPVEGEQETLVVAAVVDITARRRAEQEIRAAHARLEERIADLEAFSYIVTHDLRAPLRAIQGYARLVEDALADHADEATRQMLERMRDATLRMDHLIRDVLAYSQVSREALLAGPVDLDDVVSHVVAHYPEVAAASVRVRTPLGRVRGQDSLLVQVVSNLLGNAVKFVPEGRAPSVAVWSERRGAEMLRVVVQDNGIGIPREHWERIFRPFERLHPSEAWPGTGIGLAIVKKSVDRMGGRVGVESETGRGSRFWFELPEVKGGD